MLTLAAAALAILGAGWLVAARGALPDWIRNVEARTEIEAAFFRRMPLPGGDVLFRRPPSETRPALGAILAKQPKDAELYSLRALEDEQQLDFTAAEMDWKNYAANSADPVAAQLTLADFYHRRLRPMDEIGALSVVARASAPASEKLLTPTEERSWQAFARIFGVIAAQGVSKEISVAQYRDWLARYPREASVYGNFLEFLIAQKDYAAANQLIADYRKNFPGDDIFPVKAQALVEYRQGSLQQGLAVYEKSFNPLWAPELVKGYFDLLAQTHSLRKFLDEAHSAQNANPQDLKAATRIFYYYQQQGKIDAAQEAIENFRLQKDAAKSAWTSAELFTCARLLEDIHAYPESARYYFALYNSQGDKDAQRRSLEGLADLLFTAPETPIRFGSGELSMYRDVATLDPGPGYLNGILSLILNSDDPAAEFREEEQRASPYFRRSQAAQLLALLDGKFPASPRRAELHAKLLDYYGTAGESEAVIKGGTEFLAAFPNDSQRTEVALLMADAYARTGKTKEEFGIYDSVLQELAAKADRIPLGARAVNAINRPGFNSRAASFPGAQSAGEDSEDQNQGTINGAPARPATNSAFELNATPAPVQAGARSPEYARVLERYLARLAQLKQIPEALAVLRREIDRNPDDPGLYEQLAMFLQQNRLAAEEEQVYQRAMARFPDRSWYQKLARFYLRYQRNQDFEKLTQQAVAAFQGSELEEYFQTVPAGGAALYLRLNQYASARFPHNPVFVRNLLGAYRNPQTADPAAWEALMRQHWFEESEFRGEFFEYLTRTGKLDGELRILQQGAPVATNASWDAFVRQNPAAGEYLAEANLWRSHYEDSAPVLASLAAQYPADEEIGEAASAVHRSLAFFDLANTEIAVRVETNLVAANPGNTENLARVGDIYSDRGLFSQAASYWERIPRVAPGESGGYLEAATIYWDYFDFDNALRLLGEGRQKLNNNDLYRYESGAIFEGKRDYPQAIREYVQGALAEGAQSPAQQRLLSLARRPKMRDAVSQQTAALAAAPDATFTAVALHASVLEAQNRKPELAAFLESRLAAAATLEQASGIEDLAAAQSLDAVREHSIAKQAALSTDPVARLQLRYELVGLYEKRKDHAAAQTNVEALYKENPKILGVVRSTVDFYWRAKMYPQAIEVLSQAAKDAEPSLSKQFSFEAARKSTDRRLFPQARDLLTQLLRDSPYDSQYLAALADTYAQAVDQQGLKQFYVDQIARFRSAPLLEDERKTRIAGLRRGLIPALDRLNDPAGAVDQYIELINNFPEDEGLAAEAALYAGRNKRQAQLVDFYAKTVAQSPRDYRWPMVLARIDTSLEDFPAAIDAYAKATAVRPDRVDLRLARAALEERLMRFDDAAAEYERIYPLSYKDPQWMEKVAEIRARHGKTNETVAALKTALIDGRPEKADNYFEVAKRLEAWGLLPQARGFAEQGVQTAGGDLLAAPGNHAGAALYVRIMTRLRQQDAAYSALYRGYSAAASSLPVIEQQFAAQGIAAATDRAMRARMMESRMTNAREGMRASLVEMGNTVAQYFTPEEKTSFAQSAQKMRDSMSLGDVEAFAVPLAESAGLADREAAWRYELMLEQGARPEMLPGRMQAYADLQRRRLKFAELAPQLEQFAPRLGGRQSYIALLGAADAYRDARDEENELRVLSMVQSNFMGEDYQQRFFGLLLARRPQQLALIASQWTPVGELAADFAVAHGDAALAQTVIVARGKARPPVWSKAYSALAGLYSDDAAPDANNKFLNALGNSTIGERIGKPVDRNGQLAGNTWYYYGARYGEYLDVSKQGNAEDFLPAELELSPATSSSYLSLADYYMESGDTRAAIADYGHTLELEPNRADVHERLALAYFKQGARAEAVANWKLVFAALSKELDAARLQESFWADFGRACDDLRTRRMFTELKPQIDALLRTYLHQNGNYRSNLPLHSAYLGIGGGPAATAWLLDLASAAPNPAAVLSDVVDAPWIPLEQRGGIFQKILDAKQAAVLKTEGLERDNAQDDLITWQIRWVKYLIQSKRFSDASTFLDSLPGETRRAKAADIVPAELRVAAQMAAPDKNLDQKIAAYRTAPQDAPPPEALREAARQLAEAGDNVSARKILEFVFSREIDENHLEATNFLGLAQARIDAGDTPGAVQLLRRMALVVGNPYENLSSAAALLEKSGHSTEAIEFLDQLAKSAPWEHSFALRLAKARIAASQNADPSRAVLASIASSADSTYAVRVEAASALASGRIPSTLGSAELNLLAGDARAISAAASGQPFFSDARRIAAENIADPRAKFQLLAGALSDAPGRNDLRVAAFQAAAASRQDQLSLVAIYPILNLRNRGFAPSQIVAEEDQGGVSNVASPAGATPAGIPPPEWPQIAASIAEAMSRLDRFNEAVRYFGIAIKLERAAPRLKELNVEIASARAQQRREETNLARAPILHEALEQQRVVRPRLAALVGAAPSVPSPTPPATPPAANTPGGTKP